MKRDDLNWWLTLVANAGVIAGLVFLAYELRQNTMQLRAESSYAISESMNSINAGVYGDAELAAILIKGEQDFDSLTELERSRFVAFQFSRINLAEYILDLERGGLQGVHIRYVDYLVNDYQSKPGLQRFVQSIQPIWAGSEKLYDRLIGRPGHRGR